MKSYLKAPLFIVALASSVLSAHAIDLVNDTWNDGTRTDPGTAPVSPQTTPYSEYGVDQDADGNIESTWYSSNAAGTTVASNLLTTTVGAGSSSWTTYFTPEASPLSLSSAGDTFTVTWMFKMTGINATNASQGFRIGIVDSPEAARLTGDGSPGNWNYAGYAMFINIGSTLGRSTPFQLMERVAPTDPPTGFLSASGSWTALANAGANGNPGYTAGTVYTYTFTATRTIDNSLDIISTMTGTGLNGTDSLSVSFTDTTPNSFVFDTFGLRPSSDILSATQFDTSLFKVETNVVPEPSTVILIGAGLMVLVTLRRRHAR